MPSFVLTGTSTTPEFLGNNETGFIGVNSALVVSTADAILGTGINSLTILGALVNQSFFISRAAYEFNGTSATVLVGATGTIISHSFGILARPTSQFLLTNDGGFTTDGIALDIRTGDTAATIRVINNGTISSQSDAMVLLSGSQSTTIINTGTISGMFGGIFTEVFATPSSGTATLVNSGTIIGVTDYAYFGRSGVDDITNSGFMSGGIDLGPGDDIYNGANGTLSGAVLGGTGQDRLIGGAGIDELQGGDDNDVLKGGAGDDKLFGQGGNDKIKGGAGDDIISGAAGDDQIWGNKGEDDINGGGGDDLLRAGRMMM